MLSFRWTNPKRHHPRHTQKILWWNWEMEKPNQKLSVAVNNLKGLLCPNSLTPSMSSHSPSSVGFICCGRHLSWPQTLLGREHDDIALLKRLARSPFRECPRKIVIGLPQWYTPLRGRRRFYSGWHNGHSEEGHILRIILVGTSAKTGRVAHNTALPAGHEANTGKGSEEEISEQRISSFPNPLWPPTYFFFPGQKVTYCCPGDIRRDAYKGFLSQVSFFYIEFTKVFSI